MEIIINSFSSSTLWISSLFHGYCSSRRICERSYYMADSIPPSSPWLTHLIRTFYHENQFRQFEIIHLINFIGFIFSNICVWVDWLISYWNFHLSFLSRWFLIYSFWVWYLAIEGSCGDVGFWEGAELFLRFTALKRQGRHSFRSFLKEFSNFC